MIRVTFHVTPATRCCTSCYTFFPPRARAVAFLGTRRGAVAYRRVFYTIKISSRSRHAEKRPFRPHSRAFPSTLLRSRKKRTCKTVRNREKRVRRNVFFNRITVSGIVLSAGPFEPRPFVCSSARRRSQSYRRCCEIIIKTEKKKKIIIINK